MYIGIVVDLVHRIFNLFRNNVGKIIICVLYTICYLTNNTVYLFNTEHNCVCHAHTVYTVVRNSHLKVVGNEKEGGGGVKKVANDGNWPQTAAIEVCLPY
jgi:hypothetical protein